MKYKANFTFWFIFKFLLVLSLTDLFLIPPSLASIPSISQQMSGQERARQMQEEEQDLKTQVQQPLPNTHNKEENKQPVIASGSVALKVFVKSIKVIGVTIFSNDKIRAITGVYENKELTLADIQGMAARITDMYRKKGYILSRAYIPAQKMEQGDLEIVVLESKIGDIQLKGNHYYSTRLVESYLTIKKGMIFNYITLKENLESLNDHPDRFVQSVLVPGHQQGATDILLNEKDYLPVHVELGYNNFLSKALRQNIYSSAFTDNNFLGQDDILRFEYERGEANDYYSYTTRYLYPITKNLDFGVYASHSADVLGGEFSDVDARGTSYMYGVNGRAKFIKTDDVDFDLNFGFDYMDVYNFLEGSVSSQDRLRVPHIGFNFDLSDDWGRTVVSDDYDYGIPDLWHGNPRHIGPYDIPTSRSGAGGEFGKDTLNILRLQRLPYDSTLLWTNQLQFSPSTLTTTEQFQIGGPENNRGYPISEAQGDEGYSMSWELAEPAYFLSKSWSIPFLNTRIYDALRLIEFYDWSNVHLNSIQPGDDKNKTLSSTGCGARLNILDNLSASYEIGWPLMARSSDGKGVQQWINITLRF